MLGDCSCPQNQNPHYGWNDPLKRPDFGFRIVLCFVFSICLLWITKVLCCPLLSQVVQRIKAIENETRLLVIDREADEYRRLSQSSSPPESQPNSSAPSSPSVSNNNGEVWKTKNDTTIEDQLQNNHSTENGKQVPTERTLLLMAFSMVLHAHLSIINTSLPPGYIIRHGTWFIVHRM